MSTAQMLPIQPRSEARGDSVSWAGIPQNVFGHHVHFLLIRWRQRHVFVEQAAYFADAGTPCLVKGFLAQLLLFRWAVRFRLFKGRRTSLLHPWQCDKRIQARDAPGLGMVAWRGTHILQSPAQLYFSHRLVLDYIYSLHFFKAPMLGRLRLHRFHRFWIKRLNFIVQVSRPLNRRQSYVFHWLLDWKNGGFLLEAFLLRGTLWQVPVRVQKRWGRILVPQMNRRHWVVLEERNVAFTLIQVDDLGGQRANLRQSIIDDVRAHLLLRSCMFYSEL